MHIPILCMWSLPEYLKTTTSQVVRSMLSSSSSDYHTRFSLRSSSLQITYCFTENIANYSHWYYFVPSSRTWLTSTPQARSLSRLLQKGQNSRASITLLSKLTQPPYRNNFIPSPASANNASTTAPMETSQETSTRGKAVPLKSDEFNSSPAPSYQHMSTSEHRSVPQMLQLNTFDEGTEHQLSRWVYEVNKDNLTLAERLEKSKWEAKMLTSTDEEGQ